MSIATLQPNTTLVTGVVTFPTADTLTGTVSSSGTVVTGTGTLFLTEMFYPGNYLLQRYKYLVKPSTGEIMEIERIVSDTVLHLKTAFAVALSGAAVQAIEEVKGFKSISISPIAAGVKIFYPNKTSVTLDASTIVNLDNNDNIIKPVGLDGTTGNAQVTTAL